MLCSFIRAIRAGRKGDCNRVRGVRREKPRLAPCPLPVHWWRSCWPCGTWHCTVGFATGVWQSRSPNKKLPAARERSPGWRRKWYCLGAEIWETLCPRERAPPPTHHRWVLLSQGAWVTAGEEPWLWMAGWLPGWKTSGAGPEERGPRMTGGRTHLGSSWETARLPMFLYFHYEWTVRDSRHEARDSLLAILASVMVGAQLTLQPEPESSRTRKN